MKTIKLLSAFVALFLALTSCKKTVLAPIQAKGSSITTSRSIHIRLETTVNGTNGKFDGDIQLVTDTVLNTVLFTRHFDAPFGGSTGSFDTTFVVTSQYVNINTLLYTMNWNGSIFDYDPIADTYMTIWVDGVKKLYTKNTAIAESLNIK